MRMESYMLVQSSSREILRSINKLVSLNRPLVNNKQYSDWPEDYVGGLRLDSILQLKLGISASDGSHGSQIM